MAKNKKTALFQNSEVHTHPPTKTQLLVVFSSVSWILSPGKKQSFIHFILRPQCMEKIIN